MSVSNAHWTEDLYDLLTSSENDGDAIVEFIESSVPSDEGRLFDNKRELYLNATRPEIENKRQAKLIKHISALSNVVDESEYRYIFVGFEGDTTFTGIERLGAKGGDHLIDIDEVELQQLLEESLDPPPVVEFFEFSASGKSGLVLVVHRRERPPSVIDTTIKVSDGQSALVTKGQAYTRRGSKTTLMTHDDIRGLVEMREEIFNRKVQEWAKDLSRVVGIPSEELSELDLTVSPSDEGVKLDEVVTTAPAGNLREELYTAVKQWNTNDELLSNRSTIYRYYDRRGEFEVTNELAEFLTHSCIVNYLPGSEWIIRYQGNPGEILRDTVEYIDGNNIPMLENVLLVLGERSVLEIIRDNDKIKFSRSKAEEYINECDESATERLTEAFGTKKTITVGNEKHEVSDLVGDDEAVESLFENATQTVIRNDSDKNRSALRHLELLRLMHSLKD